MLNLDLFVKTKYGCILFFNNKITYLINVFFSLCIYSVAIFFYKEWDLEVTNSKILNKDFVFILNGFFVFYSSFYIFSLISFLFYNFINFNYYFEESIKYRIVSNIINNFDNFQEEDSKILVLIKDENKIKINFKNKKFNSVFYIYLENLKNSFELSDLFFDQILKELKTNKRIKTILKKIKREDELIKILNKLQNRKDEKGDF